MKILMVCTEKLPVPPVLGGAIQTYISETMPYLSKYHDITVLGKSETDLPNQEIIDGVQYIRVPGNILELYRDGVVQYIETNHFDLIHIFNRPRLVLPIRRVAPHSKITLSMHNDMFNLDKIDPEEANIVLEEVSNIVTVSNYVGNVIRYLYPQASSKIRTIYSGVDTARFLPGNDPKMHAIRNALRKEFGLENKKVILFAGRLSENKGVSQLIRALPQLSNTFNDLALVIVGSNWFSQNNVTDYVAYIRAISKKQQIPVVTTGFVSPFEMQNWFAAADLFVCTSLWEEPLARVHYEAMAAGLPIVTTARGGNPEVIIQGENGLIVENPEDPSEFAAKITEIFSNKSKMESMGKRGRELAVTKYIWDRVATEILEVWEHSELLSSITSEQLESYLNKSEFKPIKSRIQVEKVEQPIVMNTAEVEEESNVINTEFKPVETIIQVEKVEQPIVINTSEVEEKSNVINTESKPVETSIQVEKVEQPIVMNTPEVKEECKVINTEFKPVGSSIQIEKVEQLIIWNSSEVDEEQDLIEKIMKIESKVKLKIDKVNKKIELVNDKLQKENMKLEIINGNLQKEKIQLEKDIEKNKQDLLKFQREIVKFKEEVDKTKKVASNKEQTLLNQFEQVTENVPPEMKVYEGSLQSSKEKFEQTSLDQFRKVTNYVPPEMKVYEGSLNSSKEKFEQTSLNQFRKLTNYVPPEMKVYEGSLQSSKEKYEQKKLNPIRKLL